MCIVSRKMVLMNLFARQQWRLMQVRKQQLELDMEQQTSS